MNLIRYTFFLAFLPIALFAADETTITAKMNAYWSAWSQQELKDAAQFIAPSELEKGRKALLPVFLQAQKREEDDIQQITDLFFGEAKGDSRQSLSGEDAFIGINRIVTAFMGDSFAVISKSTIEVTNVTADGEDAVIVRYNMIYEGEVFGEDFERFVNEEGVWYLRYKEEPTVTAQKLSAVLTN